MRLILVCPSFLLGFSLLVAAQSKLPAPIEIKDPHLEDHQIGPVEVLHRSQQDMDDFKSSDNLRVRRSDGAGYCMFQVIVSPAGLVESATLKSRTSVGGPCSPYEHEAESIIRARHYEPWLVGGRPEPVQIEDYVRVLPPERWGPQVDFPKKIDRSTLAFTLERTSCFGSCPAYKVSIDGDGTVSYNGISSVGLTGLHKAYVDNAVVDNLIDRFRSANLLSALPSYRGNWTDNPTQTLTLSINGQTKKVVDYIGVDDGLPWAVRELEDAVDQAADTGRWVKGKGDLLAVLDDEKWNFAAESVDNLRIYRQAIQRGDEPLIQAFLKARAPVLSSIGDGVPPVCMAARLGSLELVQKMLQSNANLPPSVKDRCLVDAAMSGQPEMFSFWLDRGADPKAKIVYPKTTSGTDDAGDWFEQQGLLANAARSGNAELLQKVLNYKFDVNENVQNEPLLQWTIERAHTLDPKRKAGVVELLLVAGADPNAKDWNGDTALFKCQYDQELVEPLLKAGAEIDGRNRSGSTALIRYAFMEPFVKELLADGANPFLANDRGETALGEANQYGCPACAKLIQEALDKQSGVARQTHGVDN
jgi:ankyrin repeat protein